MPVDDQAIRHLPVESENGMPYDLIMLVELSCIWKARMIARCNNYARSARQYLSGEMIVYLKKKVKPFHIM